MGPDRIKVESLPQHFQYQLNSLETKNKNYMEQVFYLERIGVALKYDISPEDIPKFFLHPGRFNLKKSEEKLKSVSSISLDLGIENILINLSSMIDIPKNVTNDAATVTHSMPSVISNSSSSLFSFLSDDTPVSIESRFKETIEQMKREHRLETDDLKSKIESLEKKFQEKFDLVHKKSKVGDSLLYQSELVRPWDSQKNEVSKLSKFGNLLKGIQNIQGNVLFFIIFFFKKNL
jgi:hypothetical protein